jgi:peptide/nickel transport system substrate-binding protein
LKDVRVRKALYQAIDINQIQQDHDARHGPGDRHADLASRSMAGRRRLMFAIKYDVEAAKKLLADAGYPQAPRANTFEVDFACPNNRYINDEEICQAITAMWARLGVKAKLRTLPLVTYFPMIQRYEASIYMLGWGVPTMDALYSLQSLTRSVGAQGDGNYNVGRYSNPQMDGLVERIKKETDLKNRNELIEKALVLNHEDVAYIPLHNQVIPWAMKKNISVVHRADNRLDWRLIKVD